MLIVDDVITAGTAIRESVDIIRGHGATPAGVLIALDREERGPGRALGGPGGRRRCFGLPVIAVLRLETCMTHLEATGETAILAAVRAYRDRYGV